MEIPDPLPREVLLVAHSIFHLCGEACIAGSAPLTKHFYNVAKTQPNKQPSPALHVILKNIRSNDVDIFAPLSPQRLADSRRLDNQGVTNNSMSNLQIAEIRSQHINFHHPEFSFEAFEEFLFLRYGYQINNHKATLIQPYSIDEETYWPLSAATSAGLARIHNFGISHHSKQFNMQLILIDGYPPPNQDWLTFVTKHFDISIVRVGVEIQHLESLGTLIFPGNLLSQITSGSFACVVRPCVSFKEILTRILKYTKRGFNLQNFSFHPDCSATHREAIMLRFNHLLGPKICMQWFSEFGIARELAHTLFDYNVLPFLSCPRTWERMFTSIQEREFCSHFRSRGWMTPGLQRLSIQLVQVKIQQLRLFRATKQIKRWLCKILLARRKTAAAVMLQNWWKQLVLTRMIDQLKEVKRRRIML